MFNLTPTICNVKLSVTDSGDEGTMSRIAHMLQHNMLFSCFIISYLVIFVLYTVTRKAVCAVTNGLHGL